MAEVFNINGNIGLEGNVPTHGEVGQIGEVKRIQRQHGVVMRAVIINLGERRNERLVAIGFIQIQ